MPIVMRNAILAVWMLTATSTALAAVSEAEAQKLGQQLTAIGAEKSAGTYAAGAQPGSAKAEVQDEFAEAQDPPTRVSAWSAQVSKPEEDKPLFTINAVNAGRYREHLTESHFSLLQTYSNTYFMKVYPSRRTVRWPVEVEAATQANATRCTLKSSDELNGCRVGFPFPIPANGAEAIWNHKLRWRGNALTRESDQLVVQADGKFQRTRLAEDMEFPYAALRPGVTLGEGHREILRYLSQTLEPARLAGHFLLVHDSASIGVSGRTAWMLTPASIRSRRAPKACCDNPYEGSDGMQFFDQVDMFSGPLDHYSWKLLGKRDVFIPYNSQALAAAVSRHAELVRPSHLNQDLLRYELHRVWVVEAALRPGYAHTLRKRRFYLDEDSWTIVAVDMLDNYDQPYQFQEAHLMASAKTQQPEYVAQVLYHLNTERYFVSDLHSSASAENASVTFDPEHFSPDTLNRRAGNRR